MRKSFLPWALLAPTLLVLGVFTFYPAIYSFILSTREVDSFSRASYFVGMQNYADLFFSPDYWATLRNSFVFTLMTVVPSMVISLAVAIGLESNPFCRGIFRTIFLFPVAISSAMAAMLWLFLYNPTAGYLNYSLSLLHIDGPNWLSDPKWSLTAIAIATVWRELGFNVIFFIAGLSSVPPELREAATLDGANAFQRFWHVVLPVLSPTVFFVAIVSVIQSFQSFGQIHILTAGGPASSTNTMVYSLYRDAFENFRTGFASAQAVILFLVVLIVTVVQFYGSRRRVHYG